MIPTYKIGAREFAKDARVEIETTTREFGGHISGETRVGKLILVRDRDKAVLLDILDRPTWIPAEEIRSAREIDPVKYAQRFSEGDKVRLRRFGNLYQGWVEEIGRTRLTVRFATQKDRSKGVTRTTVINAADVVRIGR